MGVLVVDDNILDRRLIKYTLLNQLNICVDTAKDGLDALNRIKNDYFNLIITDIVMPNIEGIELVQNIQSIAPSSKIIVMSGNNPYYLYIAKKLGVDSVFTKPIDNEFFIRRVRTLLNLPIIQNIKK